MGLLERGPDRDERLLRANGGRQVFRVIPARPVEGLPHGDPKTIGRQAGGQPIHRHDPPDVEHLVVVALGLEVRVIERELPTEALQLAGDDDPVPCVEASLDVAPPEPGRLDGSGVVLEDGDRPLDAAPK